jgi:hypothetical protein
MKLPKEEHRYSFTIDNDLQAKAKDLTYLIISKCVGYKVEEDEWEDAEVDDDGYTPYTRKTALQLAREHRSIPSGELFYKCGLDEEEINGLFNMWLIYLITYPHLNPFETEIYECKNIDELRVVVQEYNNDERLPKYDQSTIDERIHEKKIEQRRLAAAERLRLEREREEERKRKAEQETLEFFEGVLKNPKPPDQVTFTF